MVAFVLWYYKWYGVDVLDAKLIWSIVVRMD